MKVSSKSCFDTIILDNNFRALLTRLFVASTGDQLRAHVLPRHRPTPVMLMLPTEQGKQWLDMCTFVQCAYLDHTQGESTLTQHPKLPKYFGSHRYFSSGARES